MKDAVLQLAADFLPVDVEPIVKFGLKYAGVLATTPPDRIARAASEEVADLVRRAREAVLTLDAAVIAHPAAQEALALLAAGDGGYPREPLALLAARLRATGGPAPLAAALEAADARHRALEHRLGWLLGGTSPERRETLDPSVDTDELHHVVTSAFRFEARVLEMIAINRIAQSSTIGAFFRSTKEAEKNSVGRFFDTYSLYANLFEWGHDSLRGREAVKRMNQIHGRYYIPNDEMKYVLLQGCFTWLDGADRIAHRKVTDRERRAMLVAWARMGRAMHIRELDDDYERMYSWYRAVSDANAAYDPLKRDSFETIVSASLSGQLPPLRDGLFAAARVAMDDSYRSALGYALPTGDEQRHVRAVFFTIGSLIEQLPYSPYIRSLQNNPARRGLTEPKELGAPERSTYMPSPHAGRPNGGMPEWQVPVRAGVDQAVPAELPEIPWEEVRKHVTDASLWFVADGYVYDVTTLLQVHPGGATILRAWAGRDATNAFRGAKHSPGTVVFSLNYRIGRVTGVPTQSSASLPKLEKPAAPAAPAASAATEV